MEKAVDVGGTVKREGNLLEHTLILNGSWSEAQQSIVWPSPKRNTHIPT